ncbi:zinc finger protein ZOP1 [Juglans microcarpa x Juglans regia]|uniref:zinc finger protein ZOP1 n=1 Tax=Juglans microcarpa x Juglans regia TaxID=2249226 RepID=UPI001B7EB1B3|nr:zinc finger protein ZOP1 [Juglans microcarpa x Juglans regia]XP_041012338.1 zinc finger protein ZOP1 [Juglans microcarpa x Juglans regia]
MTEYWVSQGNKWCDFCKIFIANNPSSIRNHELGQRHKDSVAKRLDTMRKEGAAKEKQQKEAARALEQIEAKAKRSYQKDIANLQEARDSHAQALNSQEEGEDKWEHDSGSGYYYNQSNGFYYDPNSGFYYSDAIGKWVTQEEAYATPQFSSYSKHREPTLKRPLSASEVGSVTESKGAAKVQNRPAPGPVVSTSLNPMRSVKGAPSSLTVGKRKRQDEKPKVLSKEEATALKAREAAKKRVEEREKPLLGLYRAL